MTDLTTLTLSAALTALQAREFSAVDLTRAYLDRIDQHDATIGAYLTVTRARA